MTPLFAVHLSDGVLSPAVCAACGAMLLAVLYLHGRRMGEDEIPRVGVLTAALFVASQLHLPVGFGSVHLLLNGLAGLLLGERVAVAVATAIVLQALLFAHGGLTTIGVNALVLTAFALHARFVYAVGRRLSLRAAIAGGLTGFVVSTGTVLLNTSIVAVAGGTGFEGPAAALLVMHLPVIAVETVGTGLIVGYLSVVKPEWLPATRRPAASPPRTAPPTGPAPSLRPPSAV